MNRSPAPVHPHSSSPPRSSQTSFTAPQLARGLSCTVAGQWPVRRASVMAATASQSSNSSTADITCSPSGMETASSLAPLTHGASAEYRWRNALSLTAAAHGSGAPLLCGSMAVSGFKGGVSVGGDVLLHTQDNSVPAAAVGE